MADLGRRRVPGPGRCGVARGRAATFDRRAAGAGGRRACAIGRGGLRTDQLLQLLLRRRQLGLQLRLLGVSSAACSRADTSAACAMASAAGACSCRRG